MKLLRALSQECSEWVCGCVSRLPGRIGLSVRRDLFRLLLRSNGKRILIGPGCRFDGLAMMMVGSDVILVADVFLSAAAGGKLEIGNRVALNQHTIVDASAGGYIRIGDNTIIGPNVVIRACNHRYEDVSIPIRDQGHAPGEILIDDDVWVGANAVILSGVRIGRGAIVGAGAVVSHEVESMTIVGGMPARLIKRRGPELKEGAVDAVKSPQSGFGKV